jgi:hypothetical protein
MEPRASTQLKSIYRKVGKETVRSCEEDMLVDLVARAQADVGAAFQPAILRQLADLRARDHGAFVRLRTELKTVSAIPVRELDKALANVAAESTDVEAPRPSQATSLVRLAIEAGAELARDMAGEGFVTVKGLSACAWPSVTAGFISNLCDRERRAVQVEPDGWRVIDNPPVRFWRAPGMSQLPAPERGGSIDSLRQFLNVRTGTGGEDPRFIMAVAWLLAALHPRGPYPVLALAGEHGSAKSSSLKCSGASSIRIRCRGDHRRGTIGTYLSLPEIATLLCSTI